MILLSLNEEAVTPIRVVNKFRNYYPLPGWTSLMTAALMSKGLILMFLGILGMCIERIFVEVRNRPLYIIKDKLNVN